MKNILARRSIRKYTQKPVSAKTLKELLRAAMSAPSAGNQQPWEFVVINDRSVLDQIPSVHPYALMLKEAPVAVLICGNLKREKHKDFWVQDCSAAVENLLIAATSKKLGTVWLGVYPRQDRVDGLKKLLGLPEHVIPLALVPVGHPAEKKPPVNRYDPARIYCNRWGAKK